MNSLHIVCVVRVVGSGKRGREGRMPIRDCRNKWNCFDHLLVSDCIPPPNPSLSNLNGSLLHVLRYSRFRNLYGKKEELDDRTAVSIQYSHLPPSLSLRRNSPISNSRVYRDIRNCSFHLCILHTHTHTADIFLSFLASISIL